MRLETGLLASIRVILFLILLTPLIVTPSLFFPYITGKTFYFWALVELAWGLFVALNICTKGAYLPRRHVFWWLLGAFLLVVAAADFFGAYPLRSFWSNYERMEGLVTLLHLAAYLVIFAGVMRNRVWLRWFWFAFLGVGVLVFFKGFASIAGTEGFVRMSDPIGNAIYVAIYAVLSAFVALVWVFDPWVRRHPWVLWSLIAFVALSVLALFFTGTRGAMIGFVVGLGIGFVAAAWFGSEELSLRLRRGILYAAGAVALLFVLLLLARDSAFVQNHPYLLRFSNISVTGTVSARFHVWQTALAGIKERPLLGWGQENFNIPFNAFYQPKLFADEPWFDRPHNILLGWATDAGLLGLIAYLGLFVGFLLLLYRAELLVTQRLILFGAAVAYGIHAMTVFDNLTTYLVIYSIFGWLLVLQKTQVTGDSRHLQEHASRWRCIVGGVAGLLLAGTLLLIVVVPNYLQNRAFLELLTLHGNALLMGQRGEPELANMQFAILLPSFADLAMHAHFLGRQEIREQFIHTTVRLFTQPWVSEDIKRQYLRAAAQAMQEQIKEAPQAPRLVFFLAGLYEVAGEYELARKYYDTAIELSPTRQLFWVKKAITYEKEGKLKEAAALLEKAWEIEPSNISIAVMLLQYYQRLQDTASYERVIARLQEVTGGNAKIIESALPASQ